ncbi:DUF3710 domain-containing protein [Streptomyces sp. NPDC048717]|uniref:DUF3710 domain-containing protein n=1 Tax=Streptomyces sp. NPDC048717 TaxID=3154928 RepID=UPI00342C30D5
MPETDMLDLGGLRIPQGRGIEVRLESGGVPARPLAATVLHEASALQLQAYRGPDVRWAAVRAELIEGVEDRGGTAWERPGPGGTEVRCALAAESYEGRRTDTDVRMLGREGPGWLLRGTVTGPDVDPVRGGEDWAYDYFTRVVVVPGFGRGRAASLSAVLGRARATGLIPLRFPA